MHICSLFFPIIYATPPPPPHPLELTYAFLVFSELLVSMRHLRCRFAMVLSKQTFFRRSGKSIEVPVLYCCECSCECLELAYFFPVCTLKSL